MGGFMKYKVIVLGCLSVFPVVAADLRTLSNAASESPGTHYRLYERDRQHSDAGSDTSLELELSEDMMLPSRTTSNSFNTIDIAEVASPRSRRVDRVSSRCRYTAICASVTLVGGAVAYLLINRFAL